MGQYWHLLNIDKRCIVRNVGGLKLIEFIFSKSAEQLVGLLSNPYWLKFNISSNLVRESKKKSLGSLLTSLPQEIIDMIVSLLFDGRNHDDFICLSLTCTYFFRLLAGKVQEIIIEDTGPWVGDRLIFVGDYADGYPANIATPEEEAVWDKISPEYNNPLYEMDHQTAAEGPLAAVSSFTPEDPFIVWGDRLKLVRERLKEERESLECFDRLVQLLMHTPDKVEPAMRRAVLRNLDTHEYVRDEALANSRYAYSLGEAVVVFTTWTQDGSGLQDLSGEGEWAGHHFDISAMATVADEQWVDVSDVAIDKLEMASRGSRKNGGRRLEGPTWGC
ncbi:hypothetical protein FZEAL_9394 [Fusarium zealandicum]|uniref:F-box domain-containing protein n=1 Tax=Fusarium zealandicum TaxID=1053134 RepID=A0A8H4UB74_9HYPO|nr:hypothetical protein FZEAL_9394 [Fusarium zealandicum]